MTAKPTGEQAPPESRSRLRRIAIQKSEPVPEFAAPEPAGGMPESVIQACIMKAEIWLKKWDAQPYSARKFTQTVEAAGIVDLLRGLIYLGTQVARLRTRVRELEAALKDAPTYEDMDAAQFSVNMDHADAERYRFVRRRSLDPKWTGAYRGAELDKAIDAAHAAQEKQEKP